MEKMSKIALLFLILPAFILSPPLRVGQAKSCCIKHSNTCPMHQEESDRHCKKNTQTEIQCCEDKCYPNLKYTISEKPFTNVYIFKTLLNLSSSDILTSHTSISPPSLNFTFLSDFQKKSYHSPPIYLLKSSFLN
jgi:hypothetical protein